VLDVDGNRYLDFTAGFGVAAVGHRHPRVVAAIRRQAGRLVHGLGDVHAHPLRARLALRLARWVPVDDPLVYYGISGAEAVEIALETALLVTGRPVVAAFEPAYHGLTLGARSVTSRPAFREPFAAWLGVPVHRLPYAADPSAVREVLARGDIGAVLVEPVVGREGVRVPPAGWLAVLAAATREVGALLVADEVLTGFGRTGHRFAVEADGVRPDLLVCGKALGGGLPIAAVVGRRDLLARWETPGEALRTATFVAHPLACAAALATLDVLEQERLVERAARLGALLGPRLQELAARSSVVTAVRGRGLLWGLELATPELAGALAAALLTRGVLVLTGGADGRSLQVAPPLTVAERQLETALEILADAILELSRCA
jgi:4-aminobutyrate aminotransferase-like enzyme